MSTTSAAMTIAPPEVRDEYHAFGAVAHLFRLAHADDVPSEIVVKGPAGTGKSRGILEYLNWIATECAGCRILMLRKTRRSLTESGMVTFEQKVLNPAQGVKWQASVQRYAYPNGSVIAVGGLDNPGKVMSSDWDIIYIQEANDVTEADWEACTTRLRNGVVPFQQLIGDRNPDGPNHWLRLREQSGKTLLLSSRHVDNPMLWNRQTGAWTASGAAYIAKLNELTGVRRLRLLLGIDAAAEGMVYDEWDAALHLIQRFPIPRDWPRYLSIDFGYSNPFVCQWWAMDHDGRLYRYREIYLSHRTVDQHAERIRQLTHDEPIPRAVIADPEDADGRALLTRITGWGTVPAHKTVASGIQAVKTRLVPAGDGKPRLFLMRDVLDTRDVFLADAKKPTCTEEEIEGYVWDTSNGRKRGEEPIKRDDHGLDALRYMVAYFDLAATGVSYAPSFY